MNSKHSVLLNSPPQGKLFCKSQIHLGFYQSLTNLREENIHLQPPIAFLSYLRGKNSGEALCEGPIPRHRLTKRSRPRYRHQQDGRRKLWTPLSPGTHQFNNSQTNSLMENPETRWKAHAHQASMKSNTLKH